MKPILLIPVGRHRTLSLLIPHLLRNRDSFEYCEFWMNPTWDKHDEIYIRNIANAYPDTFKLKDDGQWEVKKGFSHYSRYYDTLPKDDQLYIKLDDDIIWMDGDAIKELAKARLANPLPLIVVGNIVNNTACNVLHQNLGVYSPCWLLRDDPHCGWGHYKVEFGEAAHRTFLTHLTVNTHKQAYIYPNHLRPLGLHTPNHVFAFFGRDRLWGGDDEKELTVGLTQQTGRPILMAGNALFVHYAYTPQWSYLDQTDILKCYEEKVP